MTSPANLSELLPCPFCGRDDCLQLDERYGWQIVMCDNCGACGQYPAGRVTAEVAWNTRAMRSKDHSIAVDDVRVLLERVAPMFPITTHDTPDYAEVHFGDGINHSSQAMTMNPDHWNALNRLYECLTAIGSQSNGHTA